LYQEALAFATAMPSGEVFEVPHVCADWPPDRSYEIQALCCVGIYGKKAVNVRFDRSLAIIGNILVRLKEYISLQWS